MSSLAQHMQGMEASLARIAARVADFPADEAALTGWFHLVIDGLAGLEETHLAPYGLHQSDFRALMGVFGAEDGCAFPGELASRLRQTPANVTRIADGLVARGLVERTPCAADRRRVELRITAAGRAFVLEVLPQLSRPVRHAFACLDAAEQQQLQALLRRLVGALESEMAA